jgi:hypothetical protein
VEGAVTLVRFALGFLAVAALFTGLGWATGQRNRRSAIVLVCEALVLTLLGALWFASIGKGGWVLVFAFIGVLASGTDRWIAAVATGAPLKTAIRSTLLTAIRYVIAGGLLFLLVA